MTGSDTNDPEQRRQDLSRLVVLMLHDDFSIRELSRAVAALERRGAIVVEANTMATAKEYVQTVKVDLIVTDVDLPNDDGPAFLAWLRQRPPDKGGSTPAVAVGTNYRADATGYAACFVKPLPIEDFVRTIAAILGRRQG